MIRFLLPRPGRPSSSMLAYPFSEGADDGTAPTFSFFGPWPTLFASSAPSPLRAELCFVRTRRVFFDDGEALVPRARELLASKPVGLLAKHDLSRLLGS